MKKIILLTIFIIGFCLNLGIASQDIDDAQKFAKEFLEAEFTGDQSFRVDNTINSPEREKMIKEMYGPLIGEIFYWESAKLCVVDHYEITNIKLLDKSKAVVEVKFKEFACTGDKGYSDVPLIKTNKISYEKYNLEYKKGRWWVNDPPIPRVSRKALIEYNDKSIRLTSDFIIKKGTKIQKQVYFNLIETNNILKGKK
jgi:hypothetical protein